MFMPIREKVSFVQSVRLFSSFVCFFSLFVQFVCSVHLFKPFVRFVQVAVLCSAFYFYYWVFLSCFYTHISLSVFIVKTADTLLDLFAKRQAFQVQAVREVLLSGCCSVTHI